MLYLSGVWLGVDKSEVSIRENGENKFIQLAIMSGLKFVRLIYLF